MLSIPFDYSGLRWCCTQAILTRRVSEGTAAALLSLTRRVSVRTVQAELYATRE
jgi:hypothetical protein